MQRFLEAFILISLIFAADIRAAELKQKTPAADTIDVESDRLDVDKAKGEAVFRGNVKAIQGNTIIKSSILTLYIDNATRKISQLVADKNVYIKWEDKESTCEHAVYNLPVKVLELTGNVVITRGQERLSGQKVIVDMINERQVVESGKTSRVKLRVKSESKEAGGVFEWKK
jgi:lipopolysaccharide transport protein LptA